MKRKHGSLAGKFFIVDLFQNITLKLTNLLYYGQYQGKSLLFLLYSSKALLSYRQRQGARFLRQFLFLFVFVFSLVPISFQFQTYFFLAPKRWDWEGKKAWKTAFFYCFRPYFDRILLQNPRFSNLIAVTPKRWGCFFDDVIILAYKQIRLQYFGSKVQKIVAESPFLYYLYIKHCDGTIGIRPRSSSIRLTNDLLRSGVLSFILVKYLWLKVL